MEINTAITIGLIFSTYGFLFCIFSYYVNTGFLKMKVKEINIFSTFTKPIYFYVLKNGVQVNFGYIPINYNIAFDTGDFILNPAEQKRSDRKLANNIAFFQLMIIALLIIVVSFASLALGYNPVKIFKGFVANAYDLIAGKRSFSEFRAIVHSQYAIYGKYFYIFFVLMTYFTITAFLMALSPLSVYMTIFIMLFILGSYLVLGLKYFELPVAFYIDLLMSIIVSGFIYFLSLRFFIK